jgi:hypothetical protein
MIDRFFLGRPGNTRWVAAQSIAEEFSFDLFDG